jgi:hypothetical protein
VWRGLAFEYRRGSGAALFEVFYFDGVILSSAVFQAERKPALSEVERDLARI